MGDDLEKNVSTARRFVIADTTLRDCVFSRVIAPKRRRGAVLSVQLDLGNYVKLLIQSVA